MGEGAGRVGGGIDDAAPALGVELGGAVAPVEAVAGFGPGGWGFWRLEAGGGGVGAVGDSTEDVDVVFGLAADFAGGGLGYGCFGVGSLEEAGEEEGGGGLVEEGAAGDGGHGAPGWGNDWFYHSGIPSLKASVGDGGESSKNPASRCSGLVDFPRPQGHARPDDVGTPTLAVSRG